jgi:hypothetical protein
MVERHLPVFVVRKMRLMRDWKTVLALALTLLGPSQAMRGQSSVDRSARATASVISEIRVVKVQDPQFGLASQNEPAKTIDPNDTLHAGAFHIAAVNHNYNIVLPIQAMMTTGDGGPNKTIVIYKFTTALANGEQGQTIYLGATRSRIQSQQAGGNYTGAFTVTISYQ